MKFATAPRTCRWRYDASGLPCHATKQHTHDAAGRLRRGRACRIRRGRSRPARRAGAVAAGVRRPAARHAAPAAGVQGRRDVRPATVGAGRVGMRWLETRAAQVAWVLAAQFRRTAARRHLAPDALLGRGRASDGRAPALRRPQLRPPCDRRRSHRHGQRRGGRRARTAPRRRPCPGAKRRHFRVPGHARSGDRRRGGGPRRTAR